MSDFFSLISAIPSLISDFSGDTSNPYSEQKNQLAGRMAQISAAQTDVNNPLYKQLYGQYQDQNRQSLAQTISELQAQNRSASNMGRTPLLSPERGGEQIFRNLMQGYQGMNNQADQQTRQALSSAQSGAGNAGNYYNAIAPSAARGASAQLSGFQGIADLLRNMAGSQTKASPGPSNYVSPYDPNQTSPAMQNYTPPKDPYTQLPMGYGTGWGGY